MSQIIGQIPIGTQFTTNDESELEAEEEELDAQKETDGYSHLGRTIASSGVD